MSIFPTVLIIKFIIEGGILFTAAGRHTKYRNDPKKLCGFNMMKYNITERCKRF